MKIYLAALVAGCMAATSTMAGHPLVSEDTGVQGPGRVQLEWSADLIDSRDADASRKVSAATLSFGVSDSTDVFISLSNIWEAESNNTGQSDVTLGAKILIASQEAFSFAIRPELILPSGDEEKGLGNGRTSYAFTLIGAYESGKIPCY